MCNPSARMCLASVLLEIEIFVVILGILLSFHCVKFKGNVLSKLFLVLPSGIFAINSASKQTKIKQEEKKEQQHSYKQMLCYSSIWEIGIF